MRISKRSVNGSPLDINKSAIVEAKDSNFQVLEEEHVKAETLESRSRDNNRI